VAKLNVLQYDVLDWVTLTGYSPLGPIFRLKLLPPSSGQNTEVAHRPKRWYLSSQIQLTVVLNVLKLNESYRAVLRNHLQYGNTKSLKV
jgi:hypothetical protein